MGYALRSLEERCRGTGILAYILHVIPLVDTNKAHTPP
jgi:hypothetical protein